MGLGKCYLMDENEISALIVLPANNLLNENYFNNVDIRCGRIIPLSLLNETT